MNERVKFIARYLEGFETFSELCESFEISRKTGYKWVERYERLGPDGLAEVSRARLHHPNQVSDKVCREILAVRRKHPRWGPRKLLVVLRRQNPEFSLPAASTVGEILKKAGLNRPKKRIRRSSPYGERLGGYETPNAVWCADFKGHFAVGKERCHPLTISDGYSRYLIRCEGLARPLSDWCVPVFESAFREYGLPDAIRTDNGAPFSTLAAGGLSRLAVWWIRLGIRHERIMPGRPDQNGRHERMHATLKAETARPPERSLERQQKAFDLFRKEFNEVRPHEALSQEIPADFYKPSLRPYPKRLPELAYPAHFFTERVWPNGVISFQNTQWYLSGCLDGQVVGIEEVNDDIWKVYFGLVELGLLDFRTRKKTPSWTHGQLIRFDGEESKRGRPRKRRYGA